jgi:hypothetical protein
MPWLFSCLPRLSSRPSDVLGGWLWGAVFALIGWWAVMRVEAKA